MRRSEAREARDTASEAGHRLAALRSEQASLIQRRTDLEAQATRLEEDKAREGSLAHDAAEAIKRLTAEAEQIAMRSEEHTSELQSLMRISYAVFCLKKKTKKHKTHIMHN